MQQIEIVHIVLYLELAILRGHPAGADWRAWRMRSSDRRQEVVARQRLRSDEKAVGALERQKAGEEPSGQLTVAMTHDPHFAQLRFERAHNRIPRGPRNLEVALLEGAMLFFWRGRNLQGDARQVQQITMVRAGTCLAPP